MFKEFGAPQERKSSALGSGFIIDEKGIVVTNNHVIQDAEDIIVRVNGDKEFKATVIGADPLSDIAVLQLETKEKFIPVSFGDSDKGKNWGLGHCNWKSVWPWWDCNFRNYICKKQINWTFKVRRLYSN
jgi:S1-C subfamily serine protease